METQASKWTKVANLSKIPDGEAKAIRIGEGRSIALFNVDGKIYATDNQCPHMGYPLTRGAVRHGVLTCDWHQRSFDLEGGGCFNVECDDLQTFPAETRDDEIWIQLGDFAYKRKDEHLRLLWEGLLSEDRWTMSKAIALLLNGGSTHRGSASTLRRLSMQREEEAVRCLRSCWTMAQTSMSNWWAGGVSAMNNVTGLMLG